MKALLLEDKGQLSIREMPLPVPSGDEVLLKVSHCSICRTDAKMFRSGHRDLIMPRIMGHEISAFDSENGQRFAVWPGTSCGNCSLCKKGLENLCADMKITGFHRDGGFAEYISVPRSSLLEAPDGIPSELVCFAELLASGLNAVEQQKIVPGGKILIVGAGPAGILAGLAFHFSKTKVSIMDKDPLKIEKCGVFSKLTGIEIKTDFGDMLFDMTLNAAPGTDAFGECVKRLNPGGTLYFFSGILWDGIIPASVLNEAHYRQLKIFGVYGNTRKQMAEALKIISGNIEIFRGLIEKKLKLEDVASAMDEVLSGAKFKYTVEF